MAEARAALVASVRARKQRNPVRIDRATILADRDADRRGEDPSADPDRGTGS